MKVWKLLTNQHNCTVLPAKSFAVALFLMSCIQKDYLFPKIEGIRFNIKFCHILLVYTDPCSPFVVSNILVAAKRLPVHKNRKKTYHHRTFKVVVSKTSPKIRWPIGVTAKPKSYGKTKKPRQNKKATAK